MKFAIVMCFACLFFPLCSSENVKKHTTNAEGNAKHVSGTSSQRECTKNESEHDAQSCACAFLSACHAVTGTVYV